MKFEQHMILWIHYITFLFTLYGCVETKVESYFRYTENSNPNMDQSVKDQSAILVDQSTKDQSAILVDQKLVVDQRFDQLFNLNDMQQNDLSLSDMFALLDGRIYDRYLPNDLFIMEDLQLDLGTDLSISALEQGVTPMPMPEICNFKDDDLDGITDEGRICGSLLASKCQVTIGYSETRTINLPTTNWFQRSSRMSCPSTDNLGMDIEEEETTCASTGGDSQFHPITLYGTISSDEVLGLKFGCGLTTNEDENQVLQWVNNHCFIAIAIGNVVDSTTVIPSFEQCASERILGIINYQCIKSQQPSSDHFATMTLNQLNANSGFAIAFACDQDPLNLQTSYATQIQKSIEFFFGIQLKNVPPIQYLSEFMPPFYQCPLALESTSMTINNGVGHLCMGTYADQSWHYMPLGHQRNFLGRDHDQIIIGLFATPEFR